MGHLLPDLEDPTNSLASLAVPEVELDRLFGRYLSLLPNIRVLSVSMLELKILSHET